MVKKVIVWLVLLTSLSANGYFIWNKSEQMRVTSVYDGDTFWIKSGDRVRLLGINAPDLGKCKSEEAREALSKLVLNKVIKLTEEKKEKELKKEEK